MTDTDSSASIDKPAPSSAPSSTPAKETDSKRWYKFSRKPSLHGKERWKDASLSDKERWKEWQKAKDKEQGTAGFYTSFYKAKAGWIYFLGW